MTKTASSAPSAGSSTEYQYQQPPGRVKYQPQSSSTSSTAARGPLPQCKVKRNYACAKCAYYTQNPRSFLHHQKNVHAERLKVYECSYCLYASKHSQKLQRHVHMVHESSKKRKGHGNIETDVNGKPLTVPPVRIRMQRVYKNTDMVSEHVQQVNHDERLMIVEDVVVNDAMVDEEEMGLEDDVELEEEEVEGEDNEEEEEEEAEEEEEEEEEGVEIEELEEEEGAEEVEDETEDGSEYDESMVDHPSQLSMDPSPPSPPPVQQKKQYKQEKQSATFIRCSVCAFGSHSQTLVNRHEKTAHLKKKFFRCMKCNYVTHMRARYTKHVKYHTMPMIKCADCDFRTPYKWNLDRHNRNHSTTSPGTYKCSHCSFSADIKQSLTVHETNHHVPPVGGVLGVTNTNRRRYRVGASDAPGSAVDGTEIVTYETTKDGGIVEIMTETKSAAPTAAASLSNQQPLSKVTAVVTTAASSGSGSSSRKAVAVAKPSSDAVNATTTMTTIKRLSSPPPAIKIISVTSMPEKKVKEEKTHRRPLPKLIPLSEQQQQQLQRRNVPTIIRIRPPPVENAQPPNNEYYNAPVAGQSALSDFASIINDQCDQDNDGAAACKNDDAAGGTNVTIDPKADRRPSGSSTGSSGTSPKSKTASFFDKLKARVDETADLTCLVCRYESKCLSEFMRHQRTHDTVVPDEEDPITATAAASTATPSKTVATDKTPDVACPPAPPVTAAELKSTRCQRCRKRCKTSAELVVHLATCRGTCAATAPAVTVINQPPDDAIEENGTNNDEQENGTNNDEQEAEPEQHPMENKIFVWNMAAVPSPQHEENETSGITNDGDDDGNDAITVTPVGRPKMSKIKVEMKREDEEAEEEDDDDEEDDEEEFQIPSSVTSPNQKPQQIIRKEGKMYKTVFKCPHCTFWAATASRFHVHIVGHLNRKPFECSCCAYRSNWRWDITKHIRLKSAKRGGGEDAATVAALHQSAKVLMTDETGRRNYSKYNKYLTVMEMDIADDKAAGGDFEDGKAMLSKKIVGGGTTRKRRTTAAMNLHKQQTPTTGRVPMTGGVVQTKKIKANRNHQQQQIQIDAVKPPSTSLAGSDNRSKTVWKCKKCFFRDCDRLTVLNHVKAHYRRGEFGSGDSSPNTSGQSSSQPGDGDNAGNRKKNEMKKMAEQKEVTEKKTLTGDRRKSKTATAESLLMLSTNPKSLMLYDDENFLSCPLCDVTASSSGQLKEHMQRVHIPEETKYRCEYCPFWSEEKNAMLDHMMFAHEMEDGSVNTDLNVTDSSYKNSSFSNSIEDDMREEFEEIEENGGINNHTMSSMEVSDNGSGDDMPVMANMEVVFETSDENVVVVETVACNKPDSEEINGETMTKTTPRKSSKKSRNEYDEEITAEQITSAELATVKNTKKTTTGPSEKLTVFECGDCWYFSTDERDINAHKELHAKRGALYNCTQCIFNVTKSAVLYHHYRYAHMVDEPELRYPEDSVVRNGFWDIGAKNVSEPAETDEVRANQTSEDVGGPPLVWYYNKDISPSFTKVYKCRYCPHTNRRRHNTVEHERMHSDHPNHQNHRLLQQRAAGSSPTASPLHPCKRCTYVCNNAGVLASHGKVHSIGHSSCTVGFYDGSIMDQVQVQALKYVMELEQNLLVDKDFGSDSERAPGSTQRLLAGYGDGDTGNQDSANYVELDEPELKFCPYCPARFFFISDLRCHIQFHKFRIWKHSCDYCSFTARDQSQIVAHEMVHQDEYLQRTAELLSTGYPINRLYPKPSEYPESSNDSTPKKKVVETDTTEPDGSPRQRRAKRLRYSTNSEASAGPSTPTHEQQQDGQDANKSVKRLRRSSTVAVDLNSANVKSPTPPPPSSPPKTTVAMKPNSATSKPSTAAVKQFTCDKCPGRFIKASALAYHKGLHGGTGQYTCRRCDYTVTTYGNVIRHESVHRDLPPREKVKQQIVPKTKRVNEKKSDDSATMPPPPPAAARTSSNADEEIKEIEIDPEFGPQMLGNPSFYYPTTLKNGVSRPKRYKCLKCPSAYDSREQYKIHLTLHGARDKYSCDKCDYSVKNTANYVEHQRKHARDAEIRKNIAQAADRAKTIAAQEEAARAPRIPRKRMAVGALPPPPPPVELDPKETTFRNEISDRQSAYELNAAYGVSGTKLLGVEEAIATFKCSHCPYECSSQTSLNRHVSHHQIVPAGGQTAKQRLWKLSCRFCTYHTNSESDLTDHTSIHFLRSTGVVLSTLDAVAANGDECDEPVDARDHVELHGKRVVVRRDEEDSDGKDSDGEKPFTVFKDRGAESNSYNRRSKRFSPDCPSPPVLIDFNDNRTMATNGTGGNSSKSKQQKQQQPQQTTAYVRFLDGGKRLEFLDNRADSSGNAVAVSDFGGKKRRSFKK